MPDRYIVIAPQHKRRTEYQVSDGLPGERYYSADFYTMAEAVAFCTEQKWTFEVVDLRDRKRKLFKT